jgi:hypothetical protein
VVELVPDGTVQDVLDWVGDDPDRAEQALAAETAGLNRSTLIAKLEAVASADEEDAAMTDVAAPPDPSPPDVTLDMADPGVGIGVVHVRDANVQVPADADLVPDPDNPVPLVAEQVEFFQLAGATNGVVLSFNGTPYAFSPQMVAALKLTVEHATAGLTF